MFVEIIFDILVWLPVVSLLRFKTVCKSWFSLIESSTFVNQHLHLHSGEDALISSHFESTDIESTDIEFCLFSGRKYEMFTTIDCCDQFITTIISADDGFVEMVDSCDGIICFQNICSGNVVLWNPALKQLRVLPKPSISYRPPPPNNGGAGDVQYSNIGFGFDAKANDYKVVRFIWYSMSEFNQVELYNLRSSCSWRIIYKNGVLPFRYLQDCPRHVTSKNGTCFWLGFDNQNKCMLVSFDLKDEVLETMSLPDSEESATYCYALDFLLEKLAYIRGLGPFPLRNNNCFEIWMLNEFGVKESWHKIYNIGPIPNLSDEGLYPTGFSKNEMFLLLRTTFDYHGSNQLYLHNLVTREESKESYTPAQEPNPYYLRFFLHYNESLVSLRGGVNDED